MVASGPSKPLGQAQVVFSQDEVTLSILAQLLSGLRAPRIAFSIFMTLVCVSLIIKYPFLSQVLSYHILF